MCGIVGWVDWERNLSLERPCLERMARTLAHRGPDAKGFWISPRATLAHRRLIVIDPEGGSQPMVSDCGAHPVVITYNGEIYNFTELRAELIAKGHTFSTRSDTEVVLRSYIEWPENFLSKLNGIFAIAIWDQAKRQLVLARDHLGVKPLFYRHRSSMVLFASEIKALLAHPSVQPVVGKAGLTQALCGLPLHVPGATLYQDIQEVRPGSSVTFRSEGVSHSSYWRLESAAHADDLETTAGKIRDFLTRSVRRQLVSDVPVVTMLSGGLDSSGITALAAREFSKRHQRLACHTIQFAGENQDFKPTADRADQDLPWALEVARHLEVDHRLFSVTPEELLHNILLPTVALERPGIGQIETTLYLLCRAIKQNATVTLSGESADEVFGGYAWFHEPVALTASTFPWVARHRTRLTMNQCYLSSEMRALLRPDDYLAHRYDEAVAEVPTLAGESVEAARRRVNLYLTQTRLLPTLLDRKDRMSMASGVEVRVPFCDPRLVQYVWNIPWEMKCFGNLEKGILREALTDALPHHVLTRRKCPFPKTQSAIYTAGVRKQALEIVNDSGAALRPFMDRASIEHCNAVANQNGTLPDELIIQVEGWLKAFKIESAL